MPSRSLMATAALLFAGMALFGTATPLSKLVVKQFPVFTASLCRVVIGALVVLPFLAGRLGRIRGLTTRDWLILAAISLAGMFGFTVMLLHGMRLVPGVVGAIIMSVTPAMTATGSVLFMSDAWNRPKLIAVALAVGGILIVNVAGPTSGDLTAAGSSIRALVAGSILVFGAVCCEAAYTLIGKAATKRLDPMITVFVASALAAPLFLVSAATMERSAFDAGSVDSSGWIAMVAWGAGTLGLGSVLWYKGLQRATGTTAAGFMGVMPVSALVFSYLLLDEPVRLAHLVGFAIVFAGVLIISREHARGADDGN